MQVECHVGTTAEAVANARMQSCFVAVVSCMTLCDVPISLPKCQLSGQCEVICQGGLLRYWEPGVSTVALVGCMMWVIN